MSRKTRNGVSRGLYSYQSNALENAHIFPSAIYMLYKQVYYKIQMWKRTSPVKDYEKLLRSLAITSITKISQRMGRHGHLTWKHLRTKINPLSSFENSACPLTWAQWRPGRYWFHILRSQKKIFHKRFYITRRLNNIREWLSSASIRAGIWLFVWNFSI